MSHPQGHPGFHWFGSTLSLSTYRIGVVSSRALTRATIQGWPVNTVGVRSNRTQRGAWGSWQPLAGPLIETKLRAGMGRDTVRSVPGIRSSGVVVVEFSERFQARRGNFYETVPS